MPGNGPAFDSVDAVQSWALSRLLAGGEAIAPRGEPTRELIGQSFTLCRPRARIVHSPARRWSLRLALGEFCWHASASEDIEALAHYAPRWRAFSTDGRTVRGSCYGKRIFGREDCGTSRWDGLLDLLRRDPASRRAVIDLSGDAAPDALDPDVSCTSTFQVLVRGGAVHALVHMRSNDVIWGLPYDVFLFTMLQEMLARTLGLRLGAYLHSVGSLHLYDRHADLARRILDEPMVAAPEMAAMDPVSGLADFLEAERAVRAGAEPPSLAPYWAELASALSAAAQDRAPASASARAYT